jgi:hypothetical protein
MRLVVHVVVATSISAVAADAVYTTVRAVVGVAAVAAVVPSAVVSVGAESVRIAVTVILAVPTVLLVFILLLLLLLDVHKLTFLVYQLHQGVHRVFFDVFDGKVLGANGPHRTHCDSDRAGGGVPHVG